MRKQEITIGDHNKFQMIKSNDLNTANQEVIVSGNVCVPEDEQLYCCESIIDPAKGSINNNLLQLVDL